MSDAICDVVHLLRRTPGDTVHGVCGTLDLATVDRIAAAATRRYRNRAIRPRLDEVLAGLKPRRIVLVEQRPDVPRLTAEPIRVPFEPVELDEDDPRLSPLLSVEASRGDNPAAPQAPRAVPLQSRPIRRFAARCGRYGLIPPLVLTFYGFLYSPKFPFAGLFYFSCATIVVAVSVGLRRWAQWLIAPGCVVLRRSALLSPARRLQRCTPADTNLHVLQLPAAAGGGWLATLGHGYLAPSRILTPLEAAALLAAWTSPLPPPTREDLREYD